MNGNKDLLRIRFLSFRKNLSSYDVFIKSWFAQENFLNSIFFSNSKTIGVYYPILNEVQTFRIIRKSLLLKKRVCLPRMQDGKITFHSITNLNNLKNGRYNIKEPLSKENDECEKIDTLITPGIVFDRLGYRIGYGKGYYDGFLERFSKNNITSIGLGYEFQIVLDFISYEPHDIKLDVLITNKEIVMT
jgi:5-formyltetrahydrofolate cyclo-ligase